MKIGLSCSTIEPALTQGKIDGIGMYTKALLDAYSHQHLDVTPVSFPESNNRIKSSGITKGEIFPLPYTEATIASLITPFANLIYKNFNQQFDILHVTDHMIPRIKHTPIIATIHDALMFKHPEWYPSKFRHLKNRLRKETLKWATHFITISHAMIPELAEYMGINEKNISVVYNGIADHWLQKIPLEEKDKILKKLNLPEKFILFTGTLQPKKNVPRLIEAYLELPMDIRKEYPLVIAGKAGWDTEASLAAIDKLKMANTGYWLNYVSDKEIQVLYQTASLYVFPSLHEGFGLTLLEAFASGTPVITSNIPALTEVAGGAAQLIDPESVSDIKQAMLHTLTNPTLRDELSVKGSLRVKEFTLEKCASETLKVYYKFSNMSD